MNLHALLLLYSLSTAIAIPFDYDSQPVDLGPHPDLLAGGVTQDETTAPEPIDSQPYTTSSDSAKDSSLDTTSQSSQLQQNADPVPLATTGEDVCCTDKFTCRKQAGTTSISCYYPLEMYRCPGGYKGDLNGCTKVDAAPQREPSYSGVTNYLWFLGICFRKPKPALCPDFFNGFGGGG